MKKKIRINDVTFGVFFATVMPSLILILVLFSYTLHQSDQQQELLFQENADAVASSLDDALDKISEQGRKISISSTFRSFANNSNEHTVAKLGMDLISNGFSEMSAWNEVVYIGFSNTQCGTFSKVAKNNAVPEFFTTFLGDLTESGSITKQYVYHICPYEGHVYIVYQLIQRYGNLFFVIDPELRSDFQALSRLLPINAQLHYTAEADPMIDAAQVSLYQTRIPSLSLCYVRSPKRLFTRMDQTQLLLLPIILLAILAIPITFILFQRQLLAPLHAMTHSFHVISKGNREYRIHRNSGLYEVDSIYQGFNTMMDDLTTAEAERRQSEVDKVQAQLQYLQLQIRPHFFLNCLKNVNSLAQLGKTAEIEDLVIFLSQYLRYSFQDVNAMTSLTRELEAVKDYVNLMQCMSESAELTFSLDSEILDAECLPLTILTFIENCFKYQQGINPLLISVKARLIQESGSDLVRIRIKNNGGGFSPAIIEEYNTSDPSKLVYRSDRIGISNVRHRLWLTYGAGASVTLSNEDDLAVVEVRYPYRQTTSIPEGDSV